MLPILVLLRASNLWISLFMGLFVFSHCKIERVCIVGSGISGASTASFLKGNDTANVTIDMFEINDYGGGRIQSLTWRTNVTSVHFELGASIIHKSNHYMNSFINQLSLTSHDPPRTNKKLGIYNGLQFYFRSGWFSFFNTIRFMWRYGISDYLKLKASIGKVAESFKKFYALQKSIESVVSNANASELLTSISLGVSFNNVELLLREVGLFNLTQQSLEHYLVHTVGLSSASPLVNELLAAAVRVNYNQPLQTINAFAGAVGIIPLTDPELFAVKEGNVRIPQQLIEKNVDNMFFSHNVQIIRETDSGSFVLAGTRPTYADDKVETADFQSEECDFVVIATPLELANITFIDVEQTEYIKRSDTCNGTLPTDVCGVSDETFVVGNMSDKVSLNSALTASSSRQYKHTVATFVEGRLDPSYFHLLSGDVDNDYTQLPGTLLTCEKGQDGHGGGDSSSIDDIGFTSIGSYWTNKENNTTVYKVFSHLPLNESQLSRMFSYIHHSHNLSDGFRFRDGSVVQGVYSRDWLAYPIYTAAEQINATPSSASFNPYRGVYYVNAFESAVSCMECMAVAAKNVALLLKQELHARHAAAEKKPSDSAV